MLLFQQIKLSIFPLSAKTMFSFFFFFSPQEQELYQKEGLGVNEVHYVDNQDCIGQCPFSSEY